MVKPPVAVFGTEGRYATALFSAASKEKALETVEKDLRSFQAQLKKDTRLQEFLFDPSVKKNLKSEGLSSACDKLKVCESGIQFSITEIWRKCLCGVFSGVMFFNCHAQTNILHLLSSTL